MKMTQLQYAGRLERFFAYLLDTLVLLLPKMFLIANLGTGGLTSILSFLFDAAYHTLCLSSGWQSTVGQRLLSVHVVRMNRKPFDTAAALERYIAYFLPSLPVYSSLFSPQIGQALTGGLVIFWFAPILFTSERTGIHDQLCNTRVVTGRADEKGARK